MSIFLLILLILVLALILFLFYRWWKKKQRKLREQNFIESFIRGGVDDQDIDKFDNDPFDYKLEPVLFKP